MASAPSSVGGDPAPASLRKRAVLGSLISGGGMVANVVLRFGANVIVARMLLPDDFGLSGTVNAIVVGLQMVSDLGVPQNIIQHDRDDRDFLDTAFTLSLVRGVLLFLVGSALAWPTAYWYERPELLSLLPVAALTALFNSAVPTKYALLSRNMQIGRLTFVNLGSHVVGISVMIAYAYVYRTVWALVLGAVAAAVSKWILALVGVPGPANRLRWEKAAVRDLVDFGKWVFVSTLLVFLARHFDQLVLPKLEDMEVAGVYNIAMGLAMTPLLVGGAVIGHVLLPALSESKRTNQDLFVRNFAKARDVILPIHLYVVVGIALGGPVVIRVYQPAYADAAWICQLLVFSMWFQYLQEAWTQALVAVGDTRSQAVSNALRVGVTVPAVLVGFEYFGVPGLIAGSVLGSFAGQFFVSHRIQRLGLSVFAADFKYLGLAVFLGGGGALAAYGIAEYTGWDPLWPQLGIGVVVGLALTLWVYLKVLPRLRR